MWADRPDSCFAEVERQRQGNDGGQPKMDISNKREERLRREALKLRHQFAQGGRGVFAGVLPAESVTKVITEECGNYRERLYPPLVTLRLFIGQMLSEDHACQDIVCQYLSERTACKATGNGLNTGAYCQARQRLPLKVPEQLCQAVGDSLEAKIPKAWRWRGRHVKLFDGTTVSMPDTTENQADYPQSSEQKPGLGFPLARVGGLISLASGAVLGYAVAACKGKGTGEQTLLRSLLPRLAPGDILLADALLATWWVIADAVARGADVVMSQHGSRLTDFSQGLLLAHKDHVVTWPRPQRPRWMSIEDYQHYPLTLRIRECEVAGRMLVTTLLNPCMASARELNDLYALRWNIEVDWRTIKVTMSMDVLRCLSPEMVKKEIAVHLLAYNLVRWAMATAANLSEVLPRAIGFAGAKRALLAFSEVLRRCSKRRLSFMFATILGAIASMKLPHRPERIEPRAKKRRPKPLPLLTISRQLAREKIRTQKIDRGLIVAP